jgi:hypothetical protein
MTARKIWLYSNSLLGLQLAGWGGVGWSRELEAEAETALLAISTLRCLTPPVLKNATAI